MRRRLDRIHEATGFLVLSLEGYDIDSVRAETTLEERFVLKDSSEWAALFRSADYKRQSCWPAINTGKTSSTSTLMTLFCGLDR
ncbi:hypothetical protein CCR75_003607 [Bremia lactucae]|uniref:Uncharacterized protein n=1 Tax=Bremia lactucae TaxID=4779 RepID=A0A976IBA0_BRELC|nr:hypothetical protein CCR75_003607 [Bremia lactucae]